MVFTCIECFMSCCHPGKNVPDFNCWLRHTAIVFCLIFTQSKLEMAYFRAMMPAFLDGSI